ncbi:hypothetical protein GMES_3301 [Paraglaciecola mesophila KMM 241]|jgi:hypothetical protein|uniref:Uncharacterized protein n=1 Tax=Paraglaciecola mesophila KMM 241 TaxID=1128912 RepID=K6XYA6_9ALTE|nr:hypothetical protein [Paraglaciecola mesophila]GAC25579.1 hypothetical protein GMES_3301 [Paraglaciecola mesophila KMM 241]
MSAAFQVDGYELKTHGSVRAFELNLTRYNRSLGHKAKKQNALNAKFTDV